MLLSILTSFANIHCSFERPQYSEIRGGWETSTDDSKKEGPCSTYGAEHLCRLLGEYLMNTSLPSMGMLTRL